VCVECGAEYWIQSWKAVCPTCKAEFTLEQRATGDEEPRGRKALVSALLLAGYALYTLASPKTAGLSTVLPFIPAAVLAALTLVLALFVYLGAEPGLWASTLYGPASLMALLSSLEPLALLQAGVGVAITVSSALYLVGLRKFKSRLSQPVDARSMPEYSGWAGG
jgi:hypothetical protein